MSHHFLFFLQACVLIHHGEEIPDVTKQFATLLKLFGLEHPILLHPSPSDEESICALLRTFEDYQGLDLLSRIGIHMVDESEGLNEYSVLTRIDTSTSPDEYLIQKIIGENPDCRPCIFDTDSRRLSKFSPEKWVRILITGKHVPARYVPRENMFILESLTSVKGFKHLIRYLHEL
jgi:hypothetical protein